jgi:cytidylate kinase
MKKIIIAIDGPAGSGKSTTAREVANKLGYIYIDTGAMYRAAALAFKRMNLKFTDEDFEKLMNTIKIELKQGDNGQRTYLNGEDVSDEIRTPEITKLVSPVSANKIVREKLVEIQRQLGADGGIVMDGRDIGTVVFPNADLKIFMVASPEARAKRRTLELRAKGIDADEEEIKRELIARDKYDSTREISPLRKADDAVEIDTSALTIEEQTDKVVQLAKKIAGEV